MTYLSVCSGIEAATVAWHPLGWQPWAFAEVDKFPSAVLAHHYPNVPNLGDMTRFKDWPDANVDLLVGGTPCQSFSVAGLRAGLDDPRGSLMLIYLAIARRYRPRWLVWENVPGVLSADDGRAFGSLLGGLEELGYGFAYRVLDAQYFGLAQRRKRVFVVGHLGDWRRAAAVLLERESLSGHPAPRAQERQAVAGPIGAGSTRSGGRFGRREAAAGHIVPEVAKPLGAHALSKGRGTDLDNTTYVAEPFTLAIRGRGDSHDLEYRQDGIANAVLTPNGGRAGIGVGAIAFSVKDHGADAGDIAPTLRAGGFDKSHANGGVMPAIAFANTAGDTDLGYGVEQAPPITGRHGDPGNVVRGMQVRRLTPRECERLQGFPDDYTLIPYNGKPAKDGPRYKALGNSMAVPVMRWIGQRIQLVEDVSRSGSQKGSE